MSRQTQLRVSGEARVAAADVLLGGGEALVGVRCTSKWSLKQSPSESPMNWLRPVDEGLVQVVREAVAVAVHRPAVPVGHAAQRADDQPLEHVRAASEV